MDMMDKDKLFLVIYVNIDNIHMGDVSEYLMAFARQTTFDETVMRLIVPVRDQETRVECINPVLLTEEQYKEVEEKIKTLQEKVEEALKTLKNE